MSIYRDAASTGKIWGCGAISVKKMLVYKRVRVGIQIPKAQVKPGEYNYPLITPGLCH